MVRAELLEQARTRTSNVLCAVQSLESKNPYLLCEEAMKKYTMTVFRHRVSFLCLMLAVAVQPCCLLTTPRVALARYRM